MKLEYVLRGLRGNYLNDITTMKDKIIVNEGKIELLNIIIRTG